MTNSTKKQEFRPLITLIVILLLFAGNTQSQQRFYKVFPSQSYEYFEDLLVINENEYAFITTSFFYRVDGAGNILQQKTLKEGIYSELESIIRDGDGNYWIAAAVFDDVYNSRKVLYKLNAAGQQITAVSFNDPNSFEDIRLAATADNTFFMAYKNRVAGDALIHLLLLDKNGTTIWKKEVTDTIHHLYTIKTGPNNSADIYHLTKTSRQNLVTSVDPTGNITRQEIHLTDPADSDYYTTDFSRTTDGGFIFSGVEEKSVPLHSDGLVYKTDAAGTILWLKKFNIKQGDNFSCIAPVADGYIVLGTSGLTELSNDSGADILLIKLDKQGNLNWKKAFGGSKTDNARFLRVLDNHVLFGGQSSSPAQVASTPVLCKTDKEGNLPSPLPFQAEPLARMKKMELNAHAFTHSLTQAAAGPDQSIITGGNFLNKDDDGYYPFVACHSKEGQPVWYKQLSVHPAVLKVLKQTRADEYIAITEIRDIFSNWYDIYKLDGKGDIIRSTHTRASGIKDVISTRDGGLLITGTADISFVNFETILIKLDVAGNEQWVKTIGDLRAWETGRRITETPEQDFLIVGNKQPEYDIVSSLYVLKIDKNGNKLWSKSFPDVPATDIGYDVVITPDQHYLFAGTSNNSPFTDKNLLLIKTDKNGNLTWRKKHHVHLMDEGFQLMNSARGGFLIAGTTAEPQAGVLEKFIYLMKTDADGNQEWVEYYGKTGLQTTGPSLLATPSGDTLLAGTTQDDYAQDYMFMVKLEEPIPRSNPQEEFLKLYPNPSSGYSTLLIQQPATGPLLISIYDQGGKKLKTLKREKNGRIFQEELSLHELPGGLYYVTINLNGLLATKKLLVLR